MDSLKLHTRIEQKYRGGKDYCSGIAEIREKRNVGEIDLLAEADIENGKHNQHCAGNDGAHQAAAGTQQVRRTLSAEGVECGNPIHQHRYHNSVDLVRSQGSIETFRPEYIG